MRVNQDMVPAADEQQEKTSEWSLQIVPGVVMTLQADNTMTYQYGPGVSLEIIEHIYRYEYRRLVRWVVYRAGAAWNIREDVAEDIVQDAFTYLCEHWQRYSEYRRPIAVVQAVVRTEVKRSMVRYRSLSLDLFEPSSLEHVSLVA